MKTRYRFLRKSYAMHRMARAIERAIEARTGKEKERAAKWAAAWGLLCGINTRRVRLRSSEIKPHVDDDAWRSFTQIMLPPKTIPPMPATEMADNDGMRETEDQEMHQHLPAPPNADSGSQA
jgi:hypothetical protein